MKKIPILDLDGVEIAFILASSRVESGIRFYNDEDDSLQIGSMCRPTGYLIESHIHNSVPRTIEYTKEVLFIKSGIVKIFFYSDSKKYLCEHIMKVGDFVFLGYGGHGLEIIEEAEIIEIKQGPYVGDTDKTRFTNP
jgi:hypothetical protein|tara:strand:- start:105 stop:515 length:411 start_codon:yes stop_codon:yes gene_type:complete